MDDKWIQPPIVCDHLTKGKLLFDKKEYASATSCFRACLDNLPGQPIVNEDGDIIYTVDEIVISTRLFILRALWKQTLLDIIYTVQTLDEVKAMLKILTATTECRFVLCMLAVSTIARIINDDILYKGESVLSHQDISNMGIQACRIILDESKGNIKERINLHSIECDLYERQGDLQSAAKSIESLLKESPNVQSQQKRLRELHIKLGLIDVVEEEAKKEASRQHKKRQRINKKGQDCAKLDGILDTLQSDVSATLSRSPTYNFFGGLDNSQKSREKAAIIDWNCIPDDIQPKFENKSKEKRLLRKRNQLESLYILLSGLVEKVSTTKELGLPIHIVDFGSGSGNSCLVFAYLLLLKKKGILCRFTLIDNNPHSVKLGKLRTSKVGLDSSVQWLCQDVSNFHESFDIGLATHLCGGATDSMMEKCLMHKAAFIATPCCLGSIVFSAHENVVSQAKPGRGYGWNTNKRTSLTYPRSACFRDQITVDNYAIITRLADCSLTTDQSDNELHIKGKRFLDSDRLRLAQEANYDTSFGQLGSKIDCGPRSDVLCGICKA